MKIDKTLLKYLANYAEPDVERAPVFAALSIDSICVVPVFDERLSSLVNMAELESNCNVAFIFVFNCPDNASSESLERTQRLLESFKERFDLTQTFPHIWSSPSLIDRQIFLIDYCSDDRSIPSKQGVGLARKLGMDFAVKLGVSSNAKFGKQVSWIYSTDADVTLPDGYFDINPPEAGQVAALLPFKHCPEEGLELVTRLYDLSLRYYVTGLEWARSPYAFHTIGSTIAVTPSAYVQVRGVPKRAGGEDFYLLNKLAKVGQVKCLNHPVISIQGRLSERVPFGTGPALVKLKNMNNITQDYTYYHPKSFSVLKMLIKAVENMSLPKTWDEFCESLKQNLPNDGETVIDALIHQRIEKAFPHMLASETQNEFGRRFHEWFDAFVTLKFIHYLRDCRYPNQSIDVLSVNLGGSEKWCRKVLAPLVDHIRA